MYLSLDWDLDLLNPEPQHRTSYTYFWRLLMIEHKVLTDCYLKEFSRVTYCTGIEGHLKELICRFFLHSMRANTLLCSYALYKVYIYYIVEGKYCLSP